MGRQGDQLHGLNHNSSPSDNTIKYQLDAIEMLKPYVLLPHPQGHDESQLQATEYFTPSSLQLLPTQQRTIAEYCDDTPIGCNMECHTV